MTLSLSFGEMIRRHCIQTNIGGHLHASFLPGLWSVNRKIVANSFTNPIGVKIGHVVFKHLAPAALHTND